MSELSDAIARLEKQLGEDTPFVPRGWVLAARVAGLREAAEIAKNDTSSGWVLDDHERLVIASAIAAILARAEEVEKGLK